MKLLGYLKWQFGGIHTSGIFWGIIISVVGFVALLAGCPQPWPIILQTFGLVMIIIDGVYHWFKISYRMYQDEQERLMQTLAKKENK